MVLHSQYTSSAAARVNSKSLTGWLWTGSFSQHDQPSFQQITGVLHMAWAGESMTFAKPWWSLVAEITKSKFGLRSESGTPLYPLLRAKSNCSTSWKPNTAVLWVAWDLDPAINSDEEAPLHENYSGADEQRVPLLAKGGNTERNANKWKSAP